MERVLAIGSHYDDVEFGCGGTLLKHADAGHKILIAILNSNDDLCGSPEERKKEQAVSCKKLNADVIEFNSGANFQYVIGELDKFNPTLVYLPYEKDYHQDHVVANKIGMGVARKLHITCFAYLSPSANNYYPNCFSSIDLDKKLLLLNSFKTQVCRRPDYLTIVTKQNEFFGSLIGQPSAEGFKFIRGQINIGNF